MDRKLLILIIILVSNIFLSSFVLAHEITGDDIVDMRDVGSIARAFQSRPGDPLWNPDYDLNKDGVINFKDIATVARQYGQTVNSKDMTKYTDKTAFLISDKDWRNVLSLVPITVWTNRDGSVSKYPLLIYHEETNSFDADSIIYFMQQYQPDRVVIVGNTPQALDNLLIAEPEVGAGLTSNQITKVSTTNYHSYWSSNEYLVIVDYDNYEAGLMASVFASYHNIPILFVNSGNLNSYENLINGKVIYAVGNLEASVTNYINSNALRVVSYTLSDLQKEYIRLTNSDKIILVNPNDLNIKVTESFTPEKSTSSIAELYSKNSLGASILASAKHELIISTTSTNYQDVDSFIDDKINNLQFTPEYLTIIASPNAIEMSYPGRSADDYWSADAWYYARINDEHPYLDLAVGRIFGLTISDSSSNIARSIFYEDVLKNEDKILVTRGDPFEFAAAEVYAMGKVLSTIGYKTTITPSGTNADDWKDKFLIIYNDHGSISWAGISSYQIPYLDNSFVISLACSTCDFNEAYSKSHLFCANIIRKGGIGYIGTTDIAVPYNQAGILSQIFAMEEPIGKAFMIQKDADIKTYCDFKNCYFTDNLGYYTLIGDPTLKIKTKYNFPKPQLNFLNEDQNGRHYRITIPAMKIEIPQEVKDLCEYPDAVNSMYFIFISGGFKEYLNTNNRFLTRIENLEGQDFTAITPKADNGWIIDKESLGEKRYLWFLSSFKGSRYNNEDPYFLTANDHEFTNFDFDVTLIQKAPDIAIDKVSLINKELKFEVINIGNKEASLTLNIPYIFIQGCFDSDCNNFDFSLYYAWNLNNIEISLPPDNSKDFSLTLPDVGLNGKNFDDYVNFLTYIGLETPEDFIQQKYYNDWFVGVIK